MQVCVEVDVFSRSPLALDRGELLKIVPRRLLHARLGREIIGVIGRQIDAEIRKSGVIVARYPPYERVDIHIVRVDERYEHAKWLVALGRALLQKIDRTLAARNA